MTDDEKQFAALLDTYEDAQAEYARADRALRDFGTPNYETPYDGIHRVSLIAEFKKRRTKFDQLQAEKNEKAQARTDAAKAISDWLPSEVRDRLNAGAAVFCTVLGGVASLRKDADGYKVTKGPSIRNILDSYSR